MEGYDPVALDEQIRIAYRKCGMSVDDLLIDPEQSSGFANEVLRSLDALSQVDVPTVLRRLVALRKRGKGNGGLPLNGHSNSGPSKPR